MNEPTGQQIIAGGENVEVAFRDGSRRHVFVAQLRPSQLPEYTAAELQNELGPLSLVTGLSQADLDNLTLPSLEALLEADLRQNFTYARRYEKRRAEKISRQFSAMRDHAPQELEIVMQKLERQLSQSLGSLPVSPSAAAGAQPQK